MRIAISEAAELASRRRDIFVWIGLSRVVGVDREASAQADGNIVVILDDSNRVKARPETLVDVVGVDLEADLCNLRNGIQAHTPRQVQIDKTA